MKHFCFEEFMRSNVAQQQGFFNEPYLYDETEVYDNLETLVDNVLDPIRELVAAPVIITSGYRCEQLNKLVGGVPKSQHRTGHAADFYVKDFSKNDMKKLFVQLREKIDFDQMILYVRRGIIHISYVDAASNRDEAIIRIEM